MDPRVGSSGRELGQGLPAHHECDQLAVSQHQWELRLASASNSSDPMLKDRCRHHRHENPSLERIAVVERCIGLLQTVEVVFPGVCQVSKVSISDNHAHNKRDNMLHSL